MADRDSALREGLGRAIRDLEYAVLTVLFLALVGLGLAQIGMRNFGGSALPWADGAMRAIVLWLAMVGGVVAAGRLRHIRIDLIERLLPAPWLVWLRRLVFAATAAVCLALTWTSLDIVALEYEFRAMAFLDVPVWAVQSIVPIGFGIMAARFMARAVHPPGGALHPAEGGDETR